MGFPVPPAQGDAVAWLCFIVGVAVLSVGIFVGLRKSLANVKDKDLKDAKDAVAAAKEKAEQAKAKADEASKKTAEAADQIAAAQTALQMGGQGFADVATAAGPSVSAATSAVTGATTAADDAASSAAGAAASNDTAKTKLEQIESLIGSLPEELRFAGFLILVGTVLMGVATIQFGGTSLF